MHRDYTTPVNTGLCHSDADAGETRILPHARHDLDQPCPRTGAGRAVLFGAGFCAALDPFIVFPSKETSMR
jgi:hypothetical protein